MAPARSSGWNQPKETNEKGTGSAGRVAAAPRATSAVATRPGHGRGLAERERRPQEREAGHEHGPLPREDGKGDRGPENGGARESNAPARGHGPRAGREDEEQVERLGHVMVEVSETSPEDGGRDRGVGDGRDPRAAPAQGPSGDREEREDVERAQERREEVAATLRTCSVVAARPKRAREMPPARKSNAGGQMKTPPSGWLRYASRTGTRGKLRATETVRRRWP